MASYKIVSALDLGTSKTTAVISVVEEGAAPRVIGTATVPSKGIKKGVIINIEEAVNSIAQALSGAERMADETINEVIISVSGSSIVSKNNKGTIAITGEEIVEDDVVRAIESAKTIMLPQGYDFLHIIPREYTVDSQTGIKYPIGMSGARLEVECHFILVPISQFKNISKCIQKIGLRPQAAIFAGWADTHSVLTDTEQELGVTLLDIGAGTTDIVIFQEGGIVYSGVVPIGGANITGDIAAGLHLGSLEDAEKIKMHYKEILESPVKKSPARRGKQKEESEEDDDIVDISFLNIENLKEVSKSFLTKIIESRVEEILDLVKKEAHQAGVSVNTPAGIVVTGGTAKLHNIKGMIKNYLGVPARIGLPTGLTGMVEELQGPEFATIYGMVKYGASGAWSSDITSSVSESSGRGGFFGKISSFLKSLVP